MEVKNILEKLRRLDEGAQDDFERREAVWVALRSLNTDDKDLRGICEDIYKSYDEDPLGSHGNILRSFLFSRQLLQSP